MPKRKPSLRLPRYDYSHEGVYFVTIRTKNGQPFFGEVKNGVMQCNTLGVIVEKEWKNIPEQFKQAELINFCMMPNHAHGIIFIKEKEQGGIKPAPTTIQPRKGGLYSALYSLSDIVKWWKGKSSFLIHKHSPSFSWQRSFYDRVIRNKRELELIDQYIQMNPLFWDIEKQNASEELFFQQPKKNVFIALGSSIGDAESIFNQVGKDLENQEITVLKKSSNYKTPPYGGIAKNEFTNAVWQIETDMSPLLLLHALQKIEALHGRTRDIRWDDRTLDLDLLMYEDIVLQSPLLSLPHPEISKRDFVLQPWAEIVDERFQIPTLGALFDLLDARK